MKTARRVLGASFIGGGTNAWTLNGGCGIDGMDWIGQTPLLEELRVCYRELNR